MAKLEKVIKEWEAVLSRDPLDAPWDLIDDTLTLLKEQEAAYQGAEELLRQKTILFDDAIKRLKEQEAQKFFVDESGKITPLPVVVRCKDCKWRGTYACFCKARDDVQDDWFCSEGERRRSE